MNSSILLLKQSNDHPWEGEDKDDF